MNKVIRDGKVAVLVSSGFGSGWSTCAWTRELEEWALYSPDIVAWVEGGKVGDIREIVKKCLGDDNRFYLNGAGGLYIEWLPLGTLFLINEYDGYESVEIRDDLDWRIA